MKGNYSDGANLRLLARLDGRVVADEGLHAEQFGALHHLLLLRLLPLLSLRLGVALLHFILTRDILVASQVGFSVGHS